MKKTLVVVGIFIGFVILLTGVSIIDSNSMKLSDGVFISLLGLAAMWIDVKVLGMVK